MHISFEKRNSEILSLPSLSVHSKVLFDSFYEYRLIEEYRSNNPTERMHTARAGYIHRYGPKQWKLRSGYTENKQYRVRAYTIYDSYIYNSNKNIYFYKIKDSFITARKKKDRTYNVRDTYLCRLSYVPRKISISDGYSSSNREVHEVNLVFKDGYLHKRSFGRSYRLRDAYSEHISEIGLYRVIDEYISLDSVMPIQDGSVVYNSEESKITISLKDKDIGIESKDEIRVFVNMPPRYINYCATINSDKAYAHLKRIRAGYSLIIPNITEDISNIPISISLYRYNTENKDTRKLIGSSSYVSSDVYDPKIWSNLNAKIIDIRNETITSGTTRNVYLDSPYFEIRVKPENNCCLSKTINIGNDSSYDACKLPSSTVHIDTIEEVKQTNLSFDRYLEGFNRVKSRIEISSSNIPRP